MKRLDFIQVSLAVVLFCSTITAIGQTTYTDFNAGAAIIDMGISPQTDENGLRPYGLVVALVDASIPVNWIINPNKDYGSGSTDVLTKVDGTDITITGTLTSDPGSTAITDYACKVGPFLISAEFMADAGPIIQTWIDANPGLTVYWNLEAITAAPVHGLITSFPNIVIFNEGGPGEPDIVEGFYDRAGITTGYRTGFPEDLTSCDQFYVLSHHTDPDLPPWTQSDTDDLFDFIIGGGNLWLGCHDVSLTEDVLRRSVSDVQLNLLSNDGLIPYKDLRPSDYPWLTVFDDDDGVADDMINKHDNTFNNAEIMYNSSAAGDPIMQFVGDIEPALNGNSEHVYIPFMEDIPNSVVGDWRSTTTVGLYDNGATDPRAGGRSALVVYGQAFGNVFDGAEQKYPDAGNVLYIASHISDDNNGGEHEWVGEARLYGNFFLESTMTTAPEMIVTNLEIAEEACPGEVIPVSATVNVPGGNIDYYWDSEILSGPGGALVFSDDASAATNITIPSLITSTTIYNVTLTITYTPSIICPNPITARYISVITVNPLEYTWVGGHSGSFNGVAYDGYSWNYPPNWDDGCRSGGAIVAPTENDDCTIPDGLSHYPRYPRPTNYWLETAECKDLILASGAQIQWMQGENYTGSNEINLNVHGDMEVEENATVNINRNGVIEVGQEGRSSGTRSGASTYCSSEGSMEFVTGITLVDFNTINNATTKPAAYNDYTTISTDVILNNTYNLTVNINTAGNWTLHTFAWIDWNQDYDFDDPGESYDLGDATNVVDGPTSASPYSIAVPADAIIGTTRMRISTKWPDDPTSCESGFDGEVEDYSINVISEVVAVGDLNIHGAVELLHNDASLKILNDLYISNSNGLSTLGQVTVNGDTDVESELGIIIEADETGVGSFINHGDISFDSYAGAMVETYISGSVGSYFLHFAGPTVLDSTSSYRGESISGVRLEQFNMTTLDTYAFEWNPLADTTDEEPWINVYPFWHNVPAGNGLAISNWDAGTGTMEMVGTLVTEDITYNVQSATDNNLELVSNPFSSAIDFEDLYNYGNNANVIKGHYWIYDASTGNYYGGASGANNGMIQVGQGFFVEVNENGGDLVFSPTIRSHSKVAFRETTFDILKLEVTGGEGGYTDELTIRFDGNATLAYDENLEVKKWNSYSYDATMVRSIAEDGSELSVNAMPYESLYDAMTSIPVHFECGYESQYTFNFSGMETFEYDISIWMEDLFSGDWMSISETNPMFSFDGSPDDTKERFVLHFLGPTSLEEIDVLKNNKPIYIYASGNHVYIRNKSKQIIKEVTVYNILGQELYRDLVSDQDIYQIPIKGNTAYYIVHVRTDQSFTTEKVFIKK